MPEGVGFFINLTQRLMGRTQTSPPLTVQNQQFFHETEAEILSEREVMGGRRFINTQDLIKTNWSSTGSDSGGKCKQ